MTNGKAAAKKAAKRARASLTAIRLELDCGVNPSCRVCCCEHELDLRRVDQLFTSQARACPILNADRHAPTRSSNGVGLEPIAETTEGSYHKMS